MAGTARRIAFGSATRLANIVVTALASLLIMPFVVHTLGDRMFGIWTLVGTFVGYYGVLELGLSTAVSRYLARSIGAGDHDQCNRVFNTSLRLYLGLGGLALAVSAGIGAMGPVFGKNPQYTALFAKIIFILGLSVALMFPTKVYKGVLEAHLRFGTTAGLDLLSVLLRTGIIIPVLLAGYGVIGLAWTTFLTSLPSVALHVYLAHKELPFLRYRSEYWGRSTTKTLFSYSTFSLIAHAADILRFKVDAIVIAAFLSLTAVTHYKVAGVLVMYYFELMSSLVGVFPSVFSRQEGAQDYAGLKRTFFFASKVSLAIAAFIGFGLIAWGKAFIQRWMGPQYSDAYPILLVLVPGWIFALAQAPSIGLLYGTSKHKFFAAFNSIEGLANLGLSLLLVKPYGMIGVALGTLIPMVIIKIFVQPVYVCRVGQINYTEYLRKMARTTAVVCLSLVLPLGISLRFATPDYKVLFSIGTVSLILYLVSLWLFEFTSGDSKAVQQAIWPRLVIRKGVNS